MRRRFLNALRYGSRTQSRTFSLKKPHSLYARTISSSAGTPRVHVLDKDAA